MVAPTTISVLKTGHEPVLAVACQFKISYILKLCPNLCPIDMKGYKVHRYFAAELFTVRFSMVIVIAGLVLYWIGT